MNTVYVVGSLIAVTLAILGAGWRLAARVTRWADEVRDNTQATRKLARKHGRLRDRVNQVEGRVDRLETLTGDRVQPNPARGRAGH